MRSTCHGPSLYPKAGEDSADASELVLKSDRRMRPYGLYARDRSAVIVWRVWVVCTVVPARGTGLAFRLAGEQLLPRRSGVGYNNAFEM